MVFMKHFKFLLLILATTLFTGCATIKGTMTTFHRLGNEPIKGKSLALVVVPEAKANTLEWENIRKKFQYKFTNVGFLATAEPSTADYIGFISYGIDDGSQTVASVPIFGTSGGSRTTSGYVGGTPFVANTYSMPTFGVVGSATTSQTIYRRVIQIDIVSGNSIRTGTPKKLYEGKLISNGSCGSVAGVLDDLLAMIFESNWPDEDGKTVTRSRAYKGNC